MLFGGPAFRTIRSLIHTPATVVLVAFWCQSNRSLEDTYSFKWMTDRYHSYQGRCLHSLALYWLKHVPRLRASLSAILSNPFSRMTKFKTTLIQLKSRWNRWTSRPSVDRFSLDLAASAQMYWFRQRDPKYSLKQLSDCNLRLENRSYSPTVKWVPKSLINQRGFPRAMIHNNLQNK